MRPRARILAAFAALAVLPGAPAATRITLADCEIVTPAGSNAVVRFAVAELRKHVALVGGVELPVSPNPSAGKFPLYVGMRPADDSAVFAAEEARWRLGPAGIWLYGEDAVLVATPGDDRATATAFENHTGTLFAVHEFLEQQLGIRWIDQGDAGIAYEPSAAFTFEAGSGRWAPVFNQRQIRKAYRDTGDGDPDGLEVRPIVLSRGSIPYAFIMPTDEFQRRRVDEAVWHRRLRMGRSQPIPYGHAFTQWWFKFGQTHPGYFALNRFGKREPSPDVVQGSPERIKLCVSNPDLVRAVVREHFANHEGSIVNACENDSRGFCRCARCLALDVVAPGEDRTDLDRRHLTDRYLHFANAVQAEARKINPAARTTFYAYSQYQFPPRREKVADGVIVFFITSQTTSDDELTALLQAWKEAGAMEVYLRPNHLCDDNGMPLGFEENMFRKFQLARRVFPVGGTDYDCSWGFRPSSGIAEYIMARAFAQPDESFAHWEEHYCAGFGAAHGEIREYYRYWRQIWNQRIAPNQARIRRLTGEIKEDRDKLMQLTGLLYAEEDFDRTDGLIAAALTRELSPATRARIEQLQLANQHHRLTYRARKANALLSLASADERKSATRVVMDFRRRHRDDLNIYWEAMFFDENAYNDAAGWLRMTGGQTQRLADWSEQMAASMRENWQPDEAPLR